MKKMIWRLISAIALRFFHDRISLYCAWLDYETGFSGNGTTLLDKKPGFPKPWLPSYFRNQLEIERKEWAKMKSIAWRQSCIDVLGEDPLDW
jgi:hypothetical protein